MRIFVVYRFVSLRCPLEREDDLRGFVDHQKEDLGRLRRDPLHREGWLVHLPDQPLRRPCQEQAADLRHPPATRPPLPVRH